MTGADTLSMALANLGRRKGRTLLTVIWQSVGFAHVCCAPVCCETLT